MAVPQRRTSKTRKRIRRTHFKLEEIGLVKCPNCGEMIEPHRICPKCGYYNGKATTKAAKKAEEQAAKKPSKKSKKSK